MDAAMSGFAYTSYKHQCDQELLDRLRSAIYVLKLDAQARGGEPGPDAEQVRRCRQDLAELLGDLAARVRAVTAEPFDGGLNLPYAGLADRFLAVNPHDVEDRLDALGRLRARLSSLQPLRPRDFTALDDLQLLLEEEAAEDARGLFRL